MEGKGDIVDIVKMAVKGLSKCQEILGHYYYIGNHCIVDYEKSFSYFLKAAEKFTDARSVLGSCYENGFGCEKDFAEATKWYVKAKASGYDIDRMRAKMYESGYIFDKDLKLSIFYYLISASTGDRDSRLNVIKLREKVSGIELTSLESSS